ATSPSNWTTAAIRTPPATRRPSGRRVDRSGLQRSADVPYFFFHLFEERMREGFEFLAFFRGFRRAEPALRRFFVDLLRERQTLRIADDRVRRHRRIFALGGHVVGLDFTVLQRFRFSRFDPVHGDDFDLFGEAGGLDRLRHAERQVAEGAPDVVGFRMGLEVGDDFRRHRARAEFFTGDGEFFDMAFGAFFFGDPFGGLRRRLDRRNFRQADDDHVGLAFGVVDDPVHQAFGRKFGVAERVGDRDRHGRRFRRARVLTLDHGDALFRGDLELRFDDAGRDPGDVHVLDPGRVHRLRHRVLRLAGFEDDRLHGPTEVLADFLENFRVPRAGRDVALKVDDVQPAGRRLLQWFKA